jgi:predicted NUDIX family phosphoesterase
MSLANCDNAEMRSRKRRYVLVFESSLLDAIGKIQGYSLATQQYLELLLKPEHNKFMDRDLAERDVKFKQLIPYVVLRYYDTVFSYVRGKHSSESRLISNRSIGVGGHIEPTDISLFSSNNELYLEAAKREVNEEVFLECPYTEHIVALINDDSNDVGKVHLGIMHIWDLAEPKVTKKEGLITQAGFISIDDLKAKSDELETWSQIALQVLQDKQVPTYLSLPT